MYTLHTFPVSNYAVGPELSRNSEVPEKESESRE